MVDNIIEKNIAFLQKHGVPMETEDDISICRYGLHIIYSYIISVSVILIGSALFGRLYESAIMLFSFAVFQVFGGGFHAQTELKCLALSAAGCTAGNLAINVISEHKIFMLASAFAVSVIVVILGPVTNINHPVSKKTFKRSKHIERIVLLLNFVILALLLAAEKNTEAAVLTATLYLYIVSLTAAKVKNKR